VFYGSGITESLFAPLGDLIRLQSCYGGQFVLFFLYYEPFDMAEVAIAYHADKKGHDEKGQYMAALNRSRVV
jgi:hypothetical protein